MEIHSVLPEERARTEKGETLPWGYRYSDTSKNPKQPEETGPFGRNRSIRYTSSIGGSGARRSSTRQGTTPSRTKENTAVSDFSRLFAKEQATHQSTTILPVDTETPAADKTPTECLLYGYASKNVEWKVLSKYERIVQPLGYICEDYPREDPLLFQNDHSPMGFNRNNIVIHKNLSKEALTKSRVYKGGQHWLKITFDSWEAAERACFYSPVEIDGMMVHCELWSGRGPLTDAPIPRGLGGAGSLVSAKRAVRTVGPASGKASAVAGFEQALQGGTGSLPRSATLPDVQYARPQDDMDIVSSSTASSATATSPGHELQQQSGNILRSRSVPNLPTPQDLTAPSSQSQYMSRAPAIRRAVLRPITEALPPQQSLTERIIRSLPVVNWLLGFTTPAPVPKTGSDGKALVPVGQREQRVGLIGEGPVVRDDGTWDESGNGWYWRLWHRLDRLAGTDFCGLKED